VGSWLSSFFGSWLVVRHTRLTRPRTPRRALPLVLVSAHVGAQRASRSRSEWPQLNRCGSEKAQASTAQIAVAARGAQNRRARR